MASRNKKTTMAKLSRESKLRERRVEKAARKEARKRAAVLENSPLDHSPLEDSSPDGLVEDEDEPTPEPSGLPADRSEVV
jgi:hypothetical protein